MYWSRCTHISGITAVFLIIVLMLFCIPALADEAYITKFQNFNRDPGWDGFRNRNQPEKPPYIKQDFGYTPTKYAGGETGEIGGHIKRTVTSAFYAMKIPECGFNEKLVATGKFAVYFAHGNSGAFFGWFNDKRQGFRGSNSLGLRFDGDYRKASVTLDYANSAWKAGGVDPQVMFQADGMIHTFRIEYDPEGNNGNGTVLCQIDDQQPAVNDLLPGHKAEGAVFNRFGIYNHQVPGYDMLVFFDDVTLNGKKLDFSTDPGWESYGNRASFPDPDVEDSQNFGFSQTSYAGGKPGEIGGTFWRTEANVPTHGYYADTVGPLDMNDKLFASGKVSFTRTCVDSGMFIGWFNSKHYKETVTDGNIAPSIDHLAVMVEGPTRDGHYFRQSCASFKNNIYQYVDIGPIIPPDGKTHDWTLSYDPEANSGLGLITVTFDDKTIKMDLIPGMKESIKGFDRFGLFSARCGGHYMTIYFDDLKYTSARKASAKGKRKD